MSGYDFSQEYANALLEEADRTIEGLEARLRMSDSALTEATESIVQMREQIATITRHRDLAVEALKHVRNVLPNALWADDSKRMIDATIKESDGK